MMRLPMLFSLFIMAVMPSTATAQEASATPREPTTSITVKGLVSWLPDNDPDSVYLDKGVDGWAPGLALALAAHPGNLAFEVEVSTALPVSAMQSGRSVDVNVSRTPVQYPAHEAKHTDTLISFLAGYRDRYSRGWFEYKAGGSLIFGRSSRDGQPLENFQEQVPSRDIAGRFALTAGVDWVIRVASQRAIVIGLKHSLAFRGDDNYLFEASPLIIRAGVGFRWGLK